MRKSYMTLYIRGECEITHIKKDNIIEVTFEQAVKGGFNTLVATIDGQILSNNGFTDSDISFYLGFLQANKEGIIAESRGEL